MKKVDHVKEQELAKLKPEVAAYKESKEYKKLQEEMRKNDDDEFRTDIDPHGYDLYEKFLQNPLGMTADYASLIAKFNPESKEL